MPNNDQPDTVVCLFDEYRQFYGRESDVDAARKFLLSLFNHGESVIFIAANAGRR